jgi:hypothetical protein
LKRYELHRKGLSVTMSWTVISAVIEVGSVNATVPFGGRWGSSGSCVRGLGPVARHEPSMPADHRRRLHDQHHPNQASPIEATRQQGEDGPVSGCEAGPLDLSLQDKDLVAQGENLCVSSITTYQQQPDAGNQKPEQVRKDR